MDGRVISQTLGVTHDHRVVAAHKSFRFDSRGLPVSITPQPDFKTSHNEHDHWHSRRHWHELQPHDNSLIYLIDWYDDERLSPDRHQLNRVAAVLDHADNNPSPLIIGAYLYAARFFGDFIQPDAELAVRARYKTRLGHDLRLRGNDDRADALLAHGHQPDHVLAGFARRGVPQPAPPSSRSTTTKAHCSPPRPPTTAADPAGQRRATAGSSAI